MDVQGHSSGLLAHSAQEANGENASSGLHSVDSETKVLTFSEELHDVVLHFQIIKFSKQIFVWVGCNTTKFGHLYAAGTTRPNNTVSVTSLFGGTADNTGSSMARRLVLKTGLNIVLACNIPKDNPMLEAGAERRLIEKLQSLGYINRGPSDGVPRFSGRA